MLCFGFISYSKPFGLGIVKVNKFSSSFFQNVAKKNPPLFAQGWEKLL
jgi:hypothetical protein